jgi:hypothetical protein
MFLSDGNISMSITDYNSSLSQTVYGPYAVSGNQIVFTGESYTLNSSTLESTGPFSYNATYTYELSGSILTLNDGNVSTTYSKS